MKKNLLRTIAVALSVAVLVVSLGIAAAAAGNGQGNGNSNQGTVQGSGQGTSQGQGNRWGQDSTTEHGQYGSGNCTACQGDVEPADLTESEIEWLTYMREEEKLARDVYQAFYDQYQERIFKNIAASEQKHMDAVKTLLDRYEISDPAEGLGPGEFADEDLQALYAELIEKGSVSVEEAYKVGVEIEETDIADLNEALESAVQTDIQKVYTNLLRGSLKHLKSFTLHLVNE